LQRVDVVIDAVRAGGTDADAEDAVEPRVALVARLEERCATPCITPSTLRISPT
jgi:hypothetical protein